MRGKICFTGEPTFDELRKRAAADPQVKKVKITDVFGWDQFQEANPEGVVLFVEDSKGLRPAPGVLEKVSEGTAVYVL